MGRQFEISDEITVDVTPDDVWDAIATGPGIDAWFMGRNEVQPGEDGVVRTTLAGMVMEAAVTAWDPPRRFAYRSGEEEDGSFHAFEFLVEGRGQGSTVVRMVHSGVLGGDNWEAEYDALREGDPMYLRKLGQYLTYFLGRTATPVNAFVPPFTGDREQARGVIRRGLGLAGPVAAGEQVRLVPTGMDPIEGVVDHVSPSFLGVRTQDGLYRFIYGFDGSVGVGHHLFTPGLKPDEVRQAWQSWVEGLAG